MNTMSRQCPNSSRPRGVARESPHDVAYVGDDSRDACRAAAEMIRCDRALRREALARPAGAFESIAHAIVQPRRLALPQLDHLGHDAIATPGRGPLGHRIDVRPLDLRDQRLERGATFVHCCLWCCV